MGKMKISAMPRIELVYKGEFVYEWLYKQMYYWLQENGYKDIDGAKDKIEHLYYENIWSGGGAKEVWYWWRTTKKDSDIFHYYINVDAHLLGMSNSEKIIDGKKIKTNKTEVSLFIESYIEVETGKYDMSKNAVTKAFSPKFWTHMNHKALDQRKGELYGKTAEFINVAKQFFGMMQYKSAPMFHTKKGYPQLK